MRHEWTEKFLAALATSPNITDAARVAGITRDAAYKARKADPAFAAQWDDALEQSTDAMIGEMYRRAVHGTEKPVFHMGEIVGHVREYSDTLAIFLAKAHRREVYGDVSKQIIEDNRKAYDVGNTPDNL